MLFAVPSPVRNPPTRKRLCLAGTDAPSLLLRGARACGRGAGRFSFRMPMRLMSCVGHSRRAVAYPLVAREVHREECCLSCLRGYAQQDLATNRSCVGASSTDCERIVSAPSIV